MKLALDVLDDTTLAEMSLATSKVINKEHRISLTLRLPHAVRLFIQAYDTMVIAPDALPRELAIKRTQIMLTLMQLSDGRCSRQGKLQRIWQERTGKLVKNMVACADRPWQQLGDDTPEAHDRRATKLADERSGVTKAASACTP